MMLHMEYSLPKNMTVLEALHKMYPDSSKRTLKNWLGLGRFTIDGSPLDRGNISLVKGQILRSMQTFKPPKIPGIKILYEDRFMILIDKPIGLLSVPLDEPDGKNDALTLLRKTFGTDQIFAVHRIDRETSGILLFARGKESEKAFDQLFEKHDIQREYFAIVEGRLKENKGTWQCPLLELPSFRVIHSPDGKMAITHFEVIRRSNKYTYLKLHLETGKKHQIRVHAQMASNPILGDARYGSSENPIKRLCLHACKLGFKHPFTNKYMEFCSVLPNSFLALGGRGGSKGL